MAIPGPPATCLVASTNNDYNYSDNLNEFQESGSGDETGSESSRFRDSTESTSRDHDSGNFRSLAWSADGTSLVTTSADNTVRTFILPPNLLEPLDSQHDDFPRHHYVRPYNSHAHPTPIYATVISPYYNLASPETTLILSSPASLPIRLLSPFVPGILATYPLVNPSTEKWIAPHSLVFSVPYKSLEPEDGYTAGNSLRFLAGSQNQISVFDVSRAGSGPMTVLPTAPGNRKARRGGSTGMAGIVSAMTVSCEGILAAGTFSRGLGLYDSHGSGDTIGSWSLAGSEDGSGITSLHWSKCGRYLVAAERASDGMGVWDIRCTGKRLAWLSGRKATTVQRLGVSLGQNLVGETGEDIYAGGVDGYVRVWAELGMREGVIDSDWQWHAHEDAVSGVGVHSCGTVVGTCSGSRQEANIKQRDTESGSEDSQDDNFDIRTQKETKARDNSIRVWSLE